MAVVIGFRWVATATFCRLRPAGRGVASGAVRLRIPVAGGLVELAAGVALTVLAGPRPCLARYLSAETTIVWELAYLLGLFCSFLGFKRVLDGIYNPLPANEERPLGFQLPLR